MSRIGPGHLGCTQRSTYVRHEREYRNIQKMFFAMLSKIEVSSCTSISSRLLNGVEWESAWGVSAALLKHYKKPAISNYDSKMDVQDDASVRLQAFLELVRTTRVIRLHAFALHLARCNRRVAPAVVPASGPALRGGWVSALGA
jgi:hypothetical protein